MNHPHMTRLTAFGHGKLAEAEAKKIADHLAECETCQGFLDELPDDALLALIRPLFTPGQRSASSGQTCLPSLLDTLAKRPPTPTGLAGGPHDGEVCKRLAIDMVLHPKAAPGWGGPFPGPLSGHGQAREGRR